MHGFRSEYSLIQAAGFPIAVGLISIGAGLFFIGLGIVITSSLHQK